MPNRPITLSLAAGESAPGAAADLRAALFGVVADLVALLDAQLPSSPEFPAESLRSRLTQSRDRVGAADHPDDVTDAGLRLIGDASQTYARLSTHAQAREAEFTGVIRLLRELMDGLRGDAVAFRDDLLRSSERVADLTKIEDIRTLRRELSREVDQLRQCVQRGERQEASRLAQVAGDLRKVDERMAQATETRPGAMPPRPLLVADLTATPVPASIVLCRIDDPAAIVDGHGVAVLERVVLALAHLLTGTFGSETKVYRTDTHAVALFLPRTSPRYVAQQLRAVQARVAPEYEYERNGVTRRVVFTFSGIVTVSAGKTQRDGPEALARAETQARDLTGLSQVQVETSGIGRLVGWLSSTG